MPTSKVQATVSHDSRRCLFRRCGCQKGPLGSVGGPCSNSWLRVLSILLALATNELLNFLLRSGYIIIYGANDLVMPSKMNICTCGDGDEKQKGTTKQSGPRLGQVAHLHCHTLPGKCSSATDNSGCLGLCQAPNKTGALPGPAPSSKSLHPRARGPSRLGPLHPWLHTKHPDEAIG